MSDVKETLQDLMERRLKELGKRRGRGESISLREAWHRLPVDEHGERRPTYETFRRIRQAGHTNISDETADALATMLDVPVDQVLVAAGQRRRLGRFELPRRADRLSASERNAVLSVVDAILEAGQPKVVALDPRVPIDEDSILGYSVLGMDLVEDGQNVIVIGAAENLRRAARQTRQGSLTPGQQRRRMSAAAGEESQDPMDLPPD